MLKPKELEKIGSIGLCINHTAKMRGVWSISTSPLCNKYCIKRLGDPRMICAHCYSVNMQKMYKGLKNKLIRNSRILTTRVLPLLEMPELMPKSGLFRFESFGDLMNEIQVVNYFNIARRNSNIKCALWTKNPWVIANAIKLYGIEKPTNLRIIGSSYFVNEPMTSFYSQYDFIDNIFTVYSKDFVRANNVNITCGARSCAACRKCYEGTHGSYNICELKK